MRHGQQRDLFLEEEASERSKDDATVRSIEASRFRNTVEDAISPIADRPMSTCGISWHVTLTNAPPP